MELFLLSPSMMSGGHAIVVDSAQAETADTNVERDGHGI